jgi:hypothetical protein
MGKKGQPGSLADSNAVYNGLDEDTDKVRRFPVPHEYVDRAMALVLKIEQIHKLQYQLWRLIERAIPEYTTSEHWKLKAESPTSLYIEEVKE